MEDILFQLCCTKKDIEKIYSADGNRNLFFYPPVKTMFLRISFIVVLGVAVYLLSMNYPIISWLLALGVLAIIYCLFRLTRISAHYYSWKNSVDDYLRTLSDTIHYSIMLRDHYFEYIKPDETTIEKWENVKSLKIKDTHSFMTTKDGENYLLPAISMSRDEYEKLLAFIREKINKQSFVASSQPEKRNPT